MAGYDGDQRESIKSPSGRELFGLGDHARVTLVLYRRRVFTKA